MFLESTAHNSKTKILRRTHADNIHDVVPPGIYYISSDTQGSFLIAMDPFGDKIVPNEFQKEILERIESFFTKEKEYSRLGFKWTRGRLLHGAPGCGKTAAMRLAAIKWIEMGGIVIDFRHCLYKIDDIELTQPVMYICDDVDGLDEDDQETLTHLMDGFEDRSGYWIATTNHLDDVQERLKRHGRFDDITECLSVKEDATISIESLPITDEERVEILSRITPEMSLADFREVVIQVVIKP